MKPTLKPDGLYDLKYLFEQKLKPIYKSCVSCEHWEEEKELCKLNNLRPPARVIVYACELWVDMEIPF